MRHLVRRVHGLHVDKLETWLAVMIQAGCRFCSPMFTAASQSLARRLGVNNVQAGAWRLGLGLTASAPHHQPRGRLHPRDRKRLDFVSADDQFVACISVDFFVATGACAFCAAPA